MSLGYQCIVLHAHLTYIRDPEYESFLEENWLFEAITETYVPLILALERLRDAGIENCLTISLSPTLITMLRDPFLQARYLAHVDRLQQLAAREVHRTRGDSAFAPLARLYGDRLEEAVAVETRYGRDLVDAFARLQADGVVELITTAAWAVGRMVLHAAAPCDRHGLLSGPDSPGLAGRVRRGRLQCGHPVRSPAGTKDRIVVGARLDGQSPRAPQAAPR